MFYRLVIKFSKNRYKTFCKSTSGKFNILEQSYAIRNTNIHNQVDFGTYRILYVNIGLMAHKSHQLHFTGNYVNRTTCWKPHLTKAYTLLIYCIKDSKAFTSKYVSNLILALSLIHI